MTELPTAPPPDVQPGDERRTDAELIAASRDSPDDFALVFDRHDVAIHRYIARRLGRTEADDLLGQTFLIAFERRHRYAGIRDDALPWLYGIATNLIRRRRRDEIRQYRAYSRAGADRDHDSFDSELTRRLDAARAGRVLSRVLAGLRAADRDVLLLYAWEDLSCSFSFNSGSSSGSNRRTPASQPFCQAVRPRPERWCRWWTSGAGVS